MAQNALGPQASSSSSSPLPMPPMWSPFSTNTPTTTPCLGDAELFFPTAEAHDFPPPNDFAMADVGQTTMEPAGLSFVPYMLAPSHNDNNTNDNRVLIATKSSTAAALQEYNDDLTYWNNKRDLALGGIDGSLAESVQAMADDVECAHGLWLRLEQVFKPSEQRHSGPSSS
ncbi:hypothetical protein PG988_007801 [Apiospora saccharicola]